MLVREAMNPTVVSVGPGHTLREAARTMTAHGVGAAVVLGSEQHGRESSPSATSSAAGPATERAARSFGSRV